MAQSLMVHSIPAPAEICSCVVTEMGPCLLPGGLPLYAACITSTSASHHAVLSLAAFVPICAASESGVKS